MKIPALVLAAFACAASSASAVTLLSDSFTDLGFSNGTDANDAQWRFVVNQDGQAANFSASTGALVHTGSGLAANPQATATFSPTALVLGDTLSLTFTFSSSAAASANGIRFGFYNSGGTSQSADSLASGIGSVYQNDTGYSVFAPFRQTGTLQLYTFNGTGVSGARLLGTGGNTTVSGANLTTTVTTAANTSYSAGLSITRTATGYDYSVLYAGETLTGSTTTIAATTFDTVSFLGINGANTNFTLDNVNLSVTSAIPEPSTYAALVGALALGGAAFGRRRRAV